MDPEQRRPKRKFHQYSEDSLTRALEDVRGNKKSIRAASREYGVPRATIQDRLNFRVPEKPRQMGPNTVLNTDEEAKLENWLLTMAKCGFPRQKNELLDTVQKILKTDGRENPFKYDRPGNKWYQSFLKRHPNITQRTAEGIDKARATVTEQYIRQWFGDLEKFLTDTNNMDIMDDPERILNGDESGFSLCPKSGKVLGPKGWRNLLEVKGKEKENLTVLLTFNATGKIAPPVIVFPYVRPPRAVVESMPESWILGKSESGWMRADVFYEYVANGLNKWLEEQKIKKPVIFFIDGHKSHMSLDLSNFCDQNGIILYALPPNTTHLMQPADVSVFRPLKHEWKKTVRQWQNKPENFNSTLTKTSFCPLLADTLNQIELVDSIKNGFRKSGLFPLNPDAVDYSKCVRNVLEDINVQENKDNLDLNDFVSAKKIISTLETQLVLDGVDVHKVLEAIENLRKASLPEDDLAITASVDSRSSTLDYPDQTYIETGDGFSNNLVGSIVSMNDLTIIATSRVIMCENSEETVGEMSIHSEVESDKNCTLIFPKSDKLPQENFVETVQTVSLNQNQPVGSEVITDKTLSEFLHEQTSDEPTSRVSLESLPEHNKNQVAKSTKTETAEPNKNKANEPTKNELINSNTRKVTAEARAKVTKNETAEPTRSKESDLNITDEVIEKETNESTKSKTIYCKELPQNVCNAFDQHIKYPKPLDKKRVTKVDRGPSAISSKAWREFAEQKEKTKQNKLEEMQRRKLEKRLKAEEKQGKKIPKPKNKNNANTQTVTGKENLANNQNQISKDGENQKCALCEDDLQSDTEVEGEKNIGCDNCPRWYHLHCTEFHGMSYIEAAQRDYKCEFCDD